MHKRYHFITNMDKKTKGIMEEAIKKYYDITGFDGLSMSSKAYDCNGRELNDGSYALYCNHRYRDLTEFWRMYDNLEEVQRG